MNTNIRILQLELSLVLVNDDLQNDPRNTELILEKMRILRELSKIQKIDFNYLKNELKSLDFNLLEFCDNQKCFYHAWVRTLDGSLFEQNLLFGENDIQNFHISVIENQLVKIDYISKTFSEMNQNSFYYIGVVFGKQFSVRSPHWISEQQKTKLIQDVQTIYGHWFHFPGVVDQFIPKSLFGIDNCCPICMSDEDLETCVAVRDGKCDHAFHLNCIKEWFKKCGKRQCPYCKRDHDK